MSAITTRVSDAFIRVKDFFWAITFPIQQWWGRRSEKGKALVGLGVFTLVMALFVVGLVYSMVNKRMDPTAYRAHLVTLQEGDLPAPPIIGWSQEMLEEPPTALEPMENVESISREQCLPGGELHAAADGLYLNEMHRWSGTELVQPAYNANMRINITNARPEGYDAIDDWLNQCADVTVVEGDRTIRISHQSLPINMKSEFDMIDEGRVYTTTTAVTTPAGFQGSSTTITSLGRVEGMTIRADLTFRGTVDDNALDTMGVFWTAQTAKAIAVARADG